MGFGVTAERTSSAEYARTADKTRATLAVAQRDGKKLWEERLHVKAQKAVMDDVATSVRRDRQELDAQLEDLPRLRRKAKNAAVVEARLEARKELEDTRSAAGEARQRAEEAELAHRAAVRELLVLREQIQQELENNPLPPSPPSYEDMRQEILGSQPHMLAKFLKSMKFKDGSTLEDKFEDFQRRSFIAHKRLGSDALGRYSGPNYERWKDRSQAMQRKIDTAKFIDKVADMDRGYEGPER